MNTAKAFEELEKLFDPDLTKFKQTLEAGQVTCTFEDPQKELKVVVTTPLVYKMNDEYELKRGLLVEFAIHFKKKKCLEFFNSRMTGKWLEVAQKKIDTLLKLVELTPVCPTCDSLTYPHIDKDHQVNPRGTSFVWYTCERKKCNTNVPTPYRTGIKTAVSKYLKKEYH